MIEIEYNPAVRSYWDPVDKAIVLGSYSPQEFAHEFAHAKFGHGFQASALSEFYEERDAWREALRRLPPEEIRVSEVEEALSTYVNSPFLTSEQRRMALRLSEEVIHYAKQRKKEAR